jgi:hypothetical protein
MVSEDELRFGADAYLSKLIDSQTFLDRLWTGIKIASVGLALVSCFSFFATKKFRNMAGSINLDQKHLLQTIKRLLSFLNMLQFFSHDFYLKN